MKTFIDTMRKYEQLKKYSKDYHLCWIPYVKKYIIIEVYLEEYNNINPNLIEIITID